MYKKVLRTSGRVALFLSLIMVSAVGCTESSNKTNGNDTNFMGNIMKESEQDLYRRDMMALDAIKVAVSCFVADPAYDSNNAYNNVTTLKTIIDEDDPNKVISKSLAEVFDENGTFINKSSAFEGVTTSDVYVRIMNGAISIKIKSRNKLFDDYVAGQPILDY